MAQGQIESGPGQRRRRIGVALLGGVVLALGAGLGLWLTTPSVAQTCDRVVELASWAGELEEGEEAGVAGARDACEARYAALRERESWLRWRRRARCTRRARSIPEAGACLRRD